MGYDYDLFVIGGGSGGVRASRVASQTGAKVGLAEEFRYGGTCVIRGCVPKKLMVYASQFSELFEGAAGFGWNVGETSFNWAQFMAAKDAEIARLEGIYSKNLKIAGVTLYDARAIVTGPHEVTLASDKVITAKTILIATGGWPFIPDFPGSELAISSNEIFELKEQPKRVLIVGGGYIASEFAGIFNAMGTQTTQFYRSEQILRGFDNEVRDHVANEMRSKGVDLQVNMNVTSLKNVKGGIKVVQEGGGQFEVDQVIYATGRIPNTAGLGLEDVGVELGVKGEVKVDQYSGTSLPSIYAVGDVTDRLALTPVAIREGMAFVETVFNDNPTAPDHDLIATAVFTQPEIGAVGLSEEEARKLEEIEVYASVFRPMQHILAGKDEKMLMKLIVSKGSRKVLGCHIVGQGAGEMIQLAGIALKIGATKEDFDRTVAVHPTAAEELVTMSTPIR